MTHLYQHDISQDFAEPTCSHSSVCYRMHQTNTKELSRTFLLRYNYANATKISIPEFLMGTCVFSVRL